MNFDMTLRFNKKSFLLFLFIFCVETCIALFLTDSIIRPYGGDVLVILLMYYFFNSFIHTNIFRLLIPVVSFAYLIEFGQYIRMHELLHLPDYKIIRIILGSHFSWGDMAAYTLGGMLCYMIEKAHFLRLSRNV
jgi:Protein of unknown function (DUF2809).